MLFLSLFRGREEVFARRWYNKKEEKGYYSPVCANEWKSGICGKLAKKKCKECSNRQFLSMKSSDVDAHLRGKNADASDVIGVYPLTEDECCYFLAVDFDKEDWHKDILAFKETCDEKGFPVYIERSRSGEGAHAWFFFTDKVEASIARKFGMCLLNHAMDKRYELKFKSYDRLLPNQDKLPKGGFGNLIALPLQGLARNTGNSVFVNDKFEPYFDQWAFLSTIEKMTPNQVKVFSEILESHGELGILNEIESNHKHKPWEKKKIESLNLEKDFPQKLKLILADGIYIEKRGVSSRALNQIKRIAVYHNPEFYKAQNLRLSTRKIPRIIDCSENFNAYLKIPRGCFDALITFLNEGGILYELEERTNNGQKIKVSFQGNLRDEQIPAAKSLLEQKIGVLSATTAFGKTVIAAEIIARKKINY